MEMADVIQACIKNSGRAKMVPTSQILIAITVLQKSVLDGHIDCGSDPHLCPNAWEQNRIVTMDCRGKGRCIFLQSKAGKPDCPAGSSSNSRHAWSSERGQGQGWKAIISQPREHAAQTSAKDSWT